MLVFRASTVLRSLNALRRQVTRKPILNDAYLGRCWKTGFHFVTAAGVAKFLQDDVDAHRPPHKPEHTSRRLSRDFKILISDHGSM